jgi:uncharacterized protein
LTGFCKELYKNTGLKPGSTLLVQTLQPYISIKSLAGICKVLTKPGGALITPDFLTSNLKLRNFMDWLWITLGIILIMVGIAGSLLPLLPGPPIAFAGMLIQLFREPDPFTSKFLWIWAGIVVVSLVLDYMIPIWGTKKFGGTKYGVWGCTLGFLLAFWMGPWGVIIGPFLGAFAGEMIGGQSSKKSLRAALGSFVGFLLGSFLKLIICFMMLYYVIASA